jgi:hypothetical protein
MPLFTAKEAAAELSMSVRQLLYFVQDGSIPYVNISRTGTVRRYDPADIKAFIASRKITTEKSTAPSPISQRFTGSLPSIGNTAYERALKMASEQSRSKRRK